MGSKGNKKKDNRCQQCNYNFSERFVLQEHVKRQKTCSTCGFVACGIKKLKKHEIVHKSPQSFHRWKCTYYNCGYSTAAKYRFTRHLNTHYRGERFPCSRCDKTFAYKTTLVTHEKLHLRPAREFVKTTPARFLEQKPLFKCTECEFSTYRRPLLRRHIKHLHSNKSLYPCSKCDARFTTKIMLSRHDKISHQGLPTGWKCSSCDFRAMMKLELEDHMLKNHKNLNPYKCSECGYECAYKGMFDQHMKGVHDSKRYPCGICGFRTDNASQFRTHMARTHAADHERDFLCSLCEFRSTSNSALAIHLKRHKDFKPLECSKCNYKTVTSYTLQKHMRSHCDKCDFLADGYRLLDIHKAENHGQAFKCDRCDFVTISRRRFDRHRKQQHGISSLVLKCLLCKHLDKQEKDLLVHMKEVHNLEVSPQNNSLFATFTDTFEDFIVDNHEISASNTAPSSTISSPPSTIATKGSSKTAVLSDAVKKEFPETLINKSPATALKKSNTVPKKSSITTRKSSSNLAVQESSRLITNQLSDSDDVVQESSDLGAVEKEVSSNHATAAQFRHQSSSAVISKPKTVDVTTSSCISILTFIDNIISERQRSHAEGRVGGTQMIDSNNESQNSDKREILPATAAKQTNNFDKGNSLSVTPVKHTPARPSLNLDNSPRLSSNSDNLQSLRATSINVTSSSQVLNSGKRPSLRKIRVKRTSVAQGLNAGRVKSPPLTRIKNVPTTQNSNSNSSIELVAVANSQLPKVQHITGKLKCDMCDFMSETRAELYTHRKLSHGNKHKCLVCSFDTNSASEFGQHAVGHMEAGELLHCKLCKYSSYSYPNLQQHVRVQHRRIKDKACPQCDYVSRSNGALNRHMLTHTSSKQFSCTICDYRALQKTTLMVHMRRHTGEKPYKCSMCDYAATRQHHVTIHERTHTGEKPFACSKCSYRANDTDKLKIHMKRHFKRELYSCELCDKKFVSKTGLIGHRKYGHTTERPHQCPECDYKSKTRGVLLKHLKTHTDEKPFKCVQCSFSTRYKLNLKKHEHAHKQSRLSIKRPFTATTKSNLELHEVKHSQSNKKSQTKKIEKRHKCSECDFYASTASALRKHKAVHVRSACPDQDSVKDTKVKPFSCAMPDTHGKPGDNQNITSTGMRPADSEFNAETKRITRKQSKAKKPAMHL